MAWIESHQELSRHPKLRSLARYWKTSIPAAMGHLHLLWHYALDFAEDGRLDDIPLSEIKDAMMWDGDIETLWNGLLACGWVDHIRPGPEDYLTDAGEIEYYAIHNWEKYGGRFLEQKRKNAERQQRYRDRHNSKSNSNDNITVTSPLRNRATVQDNTGQNNTTAPLPPKPSEEPSPQQINATYEHTLNGHFDKVADRFARIDQQYTAGWLRSALLYCEAQVGPLPLPQLGKGIDLTIDQLQRAKADDKIRSPRAFARKVMIDYLTEQREEHHAA
jgi:hypothetical protein